MTEFADIRFSLTAATQKFLSGITSNATKAVPQIQNFTGGGNVPSGGTGGGGTSGGGTGGGGSGGTTNITYSLFYDFYDSGGSEYEIAAAAVDGSNVTQVTSRTS